MVEFKLVEKLLYQSEEDLLKVNLLLVMIHYGLVKKLLQKFLEQSIKIYPSISAI